MSICDILILFIKKKKFHWWLLGYIQINLPVHSALRLMNLEPKSGQTLVSENLIFLQDKGNSWKPNTMWKGNMHLCFRVWMSGFRWLQRPCKHSIFKLLVHSLASIASLHFAAWSSLGREEEEKKVLLGCLHCRKKGSWKNPRVQPKLLMATGNFPIFAVSLNV